ncbi:hypothetical protein NLJ89_g11496 [Agrocybe chaxingu]|uniref:Reverse transcriptase Ty1/copia-type domain-containing protein n=1 Tax=Agrocybe chaxingu TaxID=84603 RepID=A0A9W8JP98_9AGAR|nr:hypothetical protein NLJ89_g11496 [Agrocybe chaxingu]
MSPDPPQRHDLGDVRRARNRDFDLSRPPKSYPEAMARPDAHVWRAAMQREKESLDNMKAFRVTALPLGRKAIGVRWVFDFKYDEKGQRIFGKEKARLVAQGFTQRPEDFGETYAPVAKMTTIRAILAWAACKDHLIFQFDVKTAFLHARNHHPVYCRQIPGYLLDDTSLVLEVLVALYGLRQSAFKWYQLFMSLLLVLGLIRCEADHGLFYGYWSSSPDPSIPMPAGGKPLVLVVPIHVDDGLGVTNSEPLYKWFISQLQKHVQVIDLGPCSRFLSVSIIRDRASRRLWFSSHLYISELLDDWHMSDCKPSQTPFLSNVLNHKAPHGVKDCPLNALPDISDTDLKPLYQCLVGCLLYLTVSARPDIAFYVMWLGQFAANPDRAHFRLAKHVLHYLAGMRTLALCFGAPSPQTPDSLRGFLQNVGCSDADWASNNDRRSISGYCFFFCGSLISWSAVKQKSIALSSTEAEYYTMTHAFREAIWIRLLFSTLGFPLPKPFPLLSDNQAALKLSASHSISSRSKHIDI